MTPLCQAACLPAWPPPCSAHSEDREMLLEEADCSKLKGAELDRQACGVWVMTGFDLNVPLGALLPLMDTAIRLLYSKQGQAPPL